MSPICPSCGTPCQDGQNFCPNCGAKLSGALPIQHDSPPDPYGQWIYQTPEYGMGPGQNMAWFKFIIYFQLFCTAIVGCLSGIVAFFGSQYDIFTKDFVYRFTYMGIVDKVYGAACIVLGALALVVRSQLAHFKRGAPRHYLCLCGCSLAASVLYAAAFYIAAASLDDYFVLDTGGLLTYLFQLIASAAVLAVNAVYLKKRAGLFVN